MQDLKQTDGRPASSILTTLSPSQQTMKRESHILHIPISSMKTSNNRGKRLKYTAKRELPKSSSNIEVNMIFTVKTGDDEKYNDVNAFKTCDLCHIKLCRNPHHPGPTSVARLVAKAMADPGPPGETILQKSALLQVKNTGTNLISHKNVTLILSLKQLTLHCH